MLLKEFSDVLANPLSSLINHSFINGHFPEALKLSIVKPIFKAGSRTECSNYRPISILSSLSKIYEKVVLNRLWDFLLVNKIIFEDQHGFVKSRSTTSAIFSLTNDIVAQLDSKNHSSGVFFDLSKAFDMVDHDLLLIKLDTMGVRGVALSWFSSFLKGRKQVVEMPAVDDVGYLKQIRSSEALVSRGVPQGSILGPVLFLLFINDLPSSTNAKVCLFADDTSLSLSSPTFVELEQNIFMEANKLLQWFDVNMLKINATKTQFLNFSISKRSSQDSPSSILLDQTQVHQTDSVKFLGVYLDQHLKFHQHVDYVMGKVSSGLFVLRSLSGTTCSDVLLSAYYGLVYPFLAYALPIWGAENERTLFILKLQKKAVRIMFSLPRRHSCREVFRSSGILTFPSIYILETLTFVKGNLSKFQLNCHSCIYPLRSVKDLKIPKHYTSFFEHHLLYIGIKLFNSLPLSLKLETDQRKFKGKLKSLLLSRVCYSVREFLAGG